MKTWPEELPGEMTASRSDGSSAGFSALGLSISSLLNLYGDDKDRAWPLDLSQRAWPPKLADTPRGM